MSTHVCHFIISAEGTIRGRGREREVGGTVFTELLDTATHSITIGELGCGTLENGIIKGWPEQIFHAQKTWHLVTMYLCPRTTSNRRASTAKG
jgi:hypothetical protein